MICEKKGRSKKTGVLTSACLIAFLIMLQAGLAVALISALRVTAPTGAPFSERRL